MEKQSEKQDVREAGEQFLRTLGVNSCDCDFAALQRQLEKAIAEHAIASPPPHWEDEYIVRLLGAGDTILDLGCGQGELLARLAEYSNISCQGVECDLKAALTCIERGLPVCLMDLNQVLSNIQDQSFTYAVLERTLQTLPQPLDTLKEMLRVARYGVISFPNFAHWKVRLAFSLGGRMPMTEALPYQWHDTPNIHLCSINDFMDWTLQDKVHILAARVLVNGKVEEYREEHNLTAQQALFLVEPQ